MTDLIPMPRDWEPTRATLHQYANTLGTVARAHATPHPKWWHISLAVTPSGLETDPMPLPTGENLKLRMDLERHVVVLETDVGVIASLSMESGMTGTQFGAELLKHVADTGLDAEYAHEKYTSDDPREYRAEDAAAFLAAITVIEHHLQAHRSTLDGSVGPVQLWPHGFDLAFEWFGARESQLNLGFYPAGRPYFYSNPYPFAPSLTDHGLSAPATWHTGDWDGSILYYDDLLATDDPSTVLARYAAEVYEAVSPGLRDPAV